MYQGHLIKVTGATRHTSVTKYTRLSVVHLQLKGNLIYSLFNDLSSYTLLNVKQQLVLLCTSCSNVSIFINVKHRPTIDFCRFPANSILPSLSC